VAARLNGGAWLSLEAPAGDHRYQFRYRPWEVFVGLMASLGGIVLVVRWWLRAPAAGTPTSPPIASISMSPR
jgi:hypothetical protein